jgi:hypothetical protein
VTDTVDDIHKALLAGVRACVELPLAGTNLPFEKPTGGQPWARALVISNEPSAATLGDGGADEADGILQVDLNFPLFEGSAGVTAAAEQVRVYMRPGRILGYGDARVHLAGLAAPSSAEVSGYHRLTLTINWFARLTR